MFGVASSSFIVLGSVRDIWVDIPSARYQRQPLMHLRPNSEIAQVETSIMRAVPVIACPLLVDDDAGTPLG